MSAELERLFSADVLAAFDERARRIAEEVTRAALPDTTDGGRFLSVKEAARISGHPEGTLRKWLQRGTLRNYGRHRAPRVRLSDILNFE